MSNYRERDLPYLARYLLYNSVGIEDHKIFPSREIMNSSQHFEFPRLEEEIQPTGILPNPMQTLDDFLIQNGTIALMILRKGQIAYERYFNGYTRDSICPSFSTAKSFVSALIGIALHEKLITSLDDPIQKYLPKAPWANITIRHLLSMSSGLKYKEGGFLPWQDDPLVYYSVNLRNLALHAEVSEAPGKTFCYNNFNLVLLGMILERVCSTSVSNYLQEKIWKPIGMEFPASWSLDSNAYGMEKMESGLNARVIDFAKFGQLYLQRGEWAGKQIVPEHWVVESTNATQQDKWQHYKYLWWLSRTNKGRFTAVGNMGQFIYVAPDKETVILRFGKGKPTQWKSVYPAIFSKILEQI